VLRPGASTSSSPSRSSPALPLTIGLIAVVGGLVATQYRRLLPEPASVLLALAASGLVIALVWVLRQDKLRALALVDATARTLRESEERFRSLAASAPIGIFLTDLRGWVQYVNARFEEVAGLDADVAGHEWLCIAHPEDQPNVLAAWRQALGADAELSTRFRVPTADGEVRWVQVQAAPLRDGAGNPVGYVGSVQNVTAQVQAAELRQRLAAIVESSDDAILATGLDGTIVSWNSGAERLYGWTAEEMAGRPVSVLAPPDGADTISRALELVLRQRSSERYEGVVVTKDGRWLEVSLTTSPTREPSGTVTGTSTIARDVTERKRAERELAVTAAALKDHTVELERSNAELAEFAYVASHDLSEPLRMVSSYVQLLAKRYRGRLDDDADEFISFAVDGADRMQSLINDLLTYSRVGRVERKRGPVDVGEVLTDVLRNLSPRLEEANAKVDVNRMPVVHGDVTQLGQLLQNLIANAVKFTRPGVAPYITVGAERDEGAWRFTVSDNGIGMEPQHAERIFSMFQRLHGREAYPGTGIGLAICRKIVELHGGRIWVEPAPGGGSSFNFTIGAAPEDGA
jgi:PAS domain S-box-containing protein